jgi:hypothetical protein
VCGAVFFSDPEQADCARWLRDRCGLTENSPGTGLSTTLVLEQEAPDFSTDAGNSALIVTTKSSRPRNANFRKCRARRRNKNDRKILAHHDWLTREGTPCHGGSFLDDNS